MPPCFSTSLFNEQIGIDTVKPTIIGPTFSPNSVLLNGTGPTASFSCNDTLSGLQVCGVTATSAVPTPGVTNFPGSAGPLSTTTAGLNPVTVYAQDVAGNLAQATASYTVQYQSGGTCDGDAGHQILQPINNYPAQTLSVFKQGRTVPVKFRVCDGKGMSIGTPGTITSNPFTCTRSGSTAQAVDETVTSTTPDTTFRFDPVALQWIFNLGTSTWPGGGTTFSCTISLNDGSTIPFTFALR